MTGQLDARYQVGRAGRDAYEASVGASRPFGRVNADLRVTARRDDVSGDELRAMLTAHWTVSTSSTLHTTSRTSTTAGISNEATYSTHPVSSPGGLATSISIAQDPSSLGAAASVDYTGYRFVSKVSAVAKDVLALATVSAGASFEIGTAIAFAGGEVALSRPINDAFVIVKPNPVLEGVVIGVNPALGGYAAETSGLGAAVVPNLEPYRVHRVTLDAPSLPAGYGLGPASYTLLPTFKSGTLLRVGDEGTVFLRGTLQRDGAPLEFAVGELLSIDAPERTPIVVMTNRSGRFSAMGLRPGRYTVRLSGPTTGSATLVIPRGTSGIHVIGTIVVSEGVVSEGVVR